MTKIKLCGISRPEDIMAVNQWKPDYIGFVFYKKSVRCVSPENARRLKEQLLPGILSVGVFVNEAPEVIAELLEEGVIDAAQLHGQESSQYLHTLRGLTSKPLIQAIQIRSEKDLYKTADSTADFLLLDSGAEPIKEHPPGFFPGRRAGCPKCGRRYLPGSPLWGGRKLRY